MMKISAIRAAAGLIILLAASVSAGADEARTVEVWKSPYCGCCGAWVEHMRAAGFTVEVHEQEDLTDVKNAGAVPQALRSCHTARVGGYVIEGHVPASDIVKLLRDKPEIKGLAVPGMPVGSPGMEVASGEKDPYDVVTFDADGATTTFAEHNKGADQ